MGNFRILLEEKHNDAEGIGDRTRTKYMKENCAQRRLKWEVKHNTEKIGGKTA